MFVLTPAPQSYVSTDLGHTWRKLMTYVKYHVWGTNTNDPREVWIQTWPDQDKVGPQMRLTSDKSIVLESMDWFATFKLVKDSVAGFLVRSNVVYIAQVEQW